MTCLHYTHHYESVSEIIKLAQIALNNQSSVVFDRSEEKLAVNNGEERLTVEENKPVDKNIRKCSQRCPEEVVVRYVSRAKSYSYNTFKV